MELDNALRINYPSFQPLELPPKRPKVFNSHLATNFREKRRLGLEKYLQHALRSLPLTETTVLVEFMDCLSKLELITALARVQASQVSIDHASTKKGIGARNIHGEHCKTVFFYLMSSPCFFSLIRW